MDWLEQFIREDGRSYDLDGVVRELSGLTEAEVEWTAERLRTLLEAGFGETQALAELRLQAAGRPWLERE